MGIVLSANARIISIILLFLPFFNPQNLINILYSTITNQLPLHFGHFRDITFEGAQVARSLRCQISNDREHVEIVPYTYTARVVSSAG